MHYLFYTIFTDKNHFFGSAINNLLSTIDRLCFLDVFYHIWAEFETYKAKNVSYLKDVMSKVCKMSNNNIHSFRAYLYYIKTIGTVYDIRLVYKEAFDLCIEEKKSLMNNWISWEQMFGDAQSILETIKYTNQEMSKIEAVNLQKNVSLY